MMPSQTHASSSNDDAGLREMIARLLGEELDRRLQSFRTDLVTELRASPAEGSQGLMMARSQDDHHRQNTQFTRVTKLEFPKFGGDDVRGWMFRCEQFFRVDNVPDESKVSLISIHLYDLALMWHRRFIKIMGENVAWPLYRDSILNRFGVAYDDPLSEIKKLRQTGTVTEYIDAYDKLLCRVDLSEEQYMSFFIAGLTSEIELAIRMFKPRSLAELYGLCKLQEAKQNVDKQKQKPLLATPRFHYTHPTTITSPKPIALPAPNSNWKNKASSS